MAKKIIPGKKTVTDKQAVKAASTHALQQIKDGLPDGCSATNKLAVMKVLNPNPHGESPVWTSWAKDENGNNFLAVLKPDGQVKLVPEGKAKYRNV